MQLTKWAGKVPYLVLLKCSMACAFSFGDAPKREKILFSLIEAIYDRCRHAVQRRLTKLIM